MRRTRRVFVESFANPYLPSRTYAHKRRNRFSVFVDREGRVYHRKNGAIARSHPIDRAMGQVPKRADEGGATALPGFARVTAALLCCVPWKSYALITAQYFYAAWQRLPGLRGKP